MVALTVVDDPSVQAPPNMLADAGVNGRRSESMSLKACEKCLGG